MQTFLLGHSSFLTGISFSYTGHVLGLQSFLSSHFWELFSQSKSLTSFSRLGRATRHHSVCYVEHREISVTKGKEWEREEERRKQRSSFTGQLMGNLRSHRYKWSGPGCRTSQRWRWGRGDPQSTGKWGGWLLLEERRCCTLGEGEGGAEGWMRRTNEGGQRRGVSWTRAVSLCPTKLPQSTATQQWGQSTLNQHERPPVWAGGGRGELGRARQKV